MGKLLSLLARDESTCCTPQKYDVFLDFESKLDEYTLKYTINRFFQSFFELFSSISHKCFSHYKWNYTIYWTIFIKRKLFLKNKRGFLIEFFLDAQPSDIERETFEAVQRVLKNSESILEEIQCYKGAGKEIREAISAPTEECQRKAYLTVAPLVAKLKRFYEFSLELGESQLLYIVLFLPFQALFQNLFVQYVLEFYFYKFRNLISNFWLIIYLSILM